MTSGSTEWAKEITRLLIGKPSLSTDKLIYFGVRYGDPAICGLSPKGATELLKTIGGYRENHQPVAKLVRQDPLMLDAYGADGTHLAAIGNDGVDFDIMG
jgi:hypothetical protein